MRIILSLIILLAVISSSASAATIDPAFHFSTRETEHFHIHYHQGLEDTARRAALLAERSHSLMTAAFGWTPQEKTHIVLADSSDLANGFATVIPYNLIYVYTVPPGPGTSIGQYEDWLGMVITHEYAHILTMDSSRGYSSITRTVFGKPFPGPDIISFLSFLLTAPPNVLLPDWWLEGVSVWAETEYGGRGRGNGTFYEMYLRTAVAEDDIPSVDMINGDPPDWPGGNRPYIYGLALMRHISREYGPGTLRDLNMGHAGRLPYLISSPAQKTTGKRYSVLFRQAMDELKDEQQAKIDSITAEGLTIPAVYPVIGENMTNPSPSPDGNLLAMRASDPHRHESIIIMDDKSGKVLHDIRVRPSDGRMAWAPGGRTLYFTETELDDGYNQYADLYAYDLDKGRKRRVTTGQRLKEPAASKSGLIAAITIRAESQSLALINTSAETDGQNIQVLRDFKTMRLSHPSWCPKERHLIFSARDNAGRSYIMAYNIKEGTLSTLIEADHDLDFPTYTTDGNRVLYVSDETGVFNIYALDILTGGSRRLSNLLGGAIDLELDMSGKMIYFSNYTSDGYRAAYIGYPGVSAGDTVAPSISRSWPDEGFTNSPTPWPEEIGTEAISDKSYSALQSVMPRFWLPSFWADHQGAGPGILTAGQDALAYHSYIFTGGTGGGGRGYYDIGYRYDRYYPTIYMSAGRIPILYSDFFNSTSAVNDTDLYEQQEILSASVELAIRRLEWQAALEVGYEYRRQITLESPITVFEGRRDNIFSAISFSSALGYPYSISKEEGRRLIFKLRDYSKSRNSDLDAREYTARYEEFTGFGGHRVLYLLLGGGASTGDRIAQQSFRIGGTAAENMDYPLRGYPPGYRAGDYIAFTTLEIRLALFNIQRGPGTLPLFLRQLHMALFAEAAAVWNKGESLNQEIADPSAGIELRLDVNLGYKMHVTPALGYAHGFSKDIGRDAVYLVISAEL